MKRMCVVAASLALVVPSSAMARGSSGGGGGGGGGGHSSFSSSSSSGRSYSSSSSSKPGSVSSGKYSSGSKPSSTSGKSYAASVGKPASASVTKPSSGPRAQPAPVSTLVPPTPPPSLSRPGAIPAGRNYTSDRTVILAHPYYADPYSRSYYGYPSSPFFYMWLAEQGQHNAPLVPQSYTPNRDTDGDGGGWMVFWGLIGLCVGGGGGFYAGRSRY